MKLSYIVEQLSNIVDELSESMITMGKNVMVRMPLMMKDQKTGMDVYKYANYVGKKAVAGKSIQKTHGDVEVYYLSGKKKDGYTLKVSPNGMYSFHSVRRNKPIALGTMRDRYAPEIIYK